VSLGSQTHATNIVTDVSHGFTGWTHTTFTFTADDSSDVLVLPRRRHAERRAAILTAGRRDHAAVPEPASMTLMGSGLAVLGFIRRRRARK
jgi:hypothetical protein